MSSHAERHHRIDAARAASDNRHLLFLFRFRNNAVPEHVGHAAHGVDRAVNHLRYHDMLGAGIASEAGDSFFRPVFRVFPGHIGIRMQRSAHGDEISPASGNDFFRVIDAGNRANGIDQKIRMRFLDIPGIMHVEAPGHQGVLAPVPVIFILTEGEGMKACGYMEDINMSF